MQPSFIGRNMLFIRCSIKIAAGFFKGLRHGLENMNLLSNAYSDGKKHKLGLTILPAKK
jgi:hypothetical protein